MAKALEQAGLDYVDISSGNITPDSRPPTDPGYNVPIAEQVRRATGLKVRTVGMIVTAKQAETIVAEGKADMIAMARSFLDDPHWGWHAAQSLGAEMARPPQYQRAAPALWPGAALRG
jgi:2,4-dienoyl-CoA reductase-like NADH-dependent reductase (Old Yellow Enzyme family)